MKVISILLGIALLASPLYAKELVTVKGTDDVTAKVFLVTDTPVVGKNTIRVELNDSSGKAITDAKVKAYYSMAPMKGMAPMIYKARAKLNGDSYIATLDIGMKGHWELKLKIRRKKASTFNVETSFKIK